MEKERGRGGKKERKGRKEERKTKERREEKRRKREREKEGKEIKNNELSKERSIHLHSIMLGLEARVHQEQVSRVGW